MSVVQKHTVDKDKLITLSDTAKKHLLSFLQQDPNRIGVRLSLKKYGCSGFAYVIDYVDDQIEGDAVINLDSSYQIFIDKKHLPLISGTHIDYVKEGLSSKLTFANPRQKNVCGCGESFIID